MSRSTAKAKKKGHAKVKELNAGGQKVRIVEGERASALWIDGTRRRYFETGDGFTLREAAYEPPEKTLLAAVKRFCERKP